MEEECSITKVSAEHIFTLCPLLSMWAVSLILIGLQDSSYWPHLMSKYYLLCLPTRKRTGEWLISWGKLKTEATGISDVPLSQAGMAWDSFGKHCQFNEEGSGKTQTSQCPGKIMKQIFLNVISGHMKEVKVMRWLVQWTRGWKWMSFTLTLVNLLLPFPKASFQLPGKVWLVWVEQ